MSRRKYRSLSLAVAAGLMMGVVGLFQPVGEARLRDVLPTGGIALRLLSRLSMMGGT